VAAALAGDPEAALAAMTEAAGRVLAAQDLDEGLFAVTHTALALLAGDMAGVLLVDGDEVVMRIAATPETESDGPALADEVLAAIGAVTKVDERG
jgi:hypothetical protein